MPGAGTVHKQVHLLSDMAIGLSDGIVVLLALTAGMGRVVAQLNYLLFTAAVAILVGAIAIAISRYYTEKEGEEDEQHAANEVKGLSHLGLKETTRVEIITEMEKEEKSEFSKLMDEHTDLQEAKRSALNISFFYAIGGLFPLLPYVLITDRPTAFLWSAIVSVLCLLLVGYIKATIHTRKILNEMLLQSISGALAAVAGYFIGGIFL